MNLRMTNQEIKNVIKYVVTYQNEAIAPKDMKFEESQMTQAFVVNCDSMSFFMEEELATNVFQAFFGAVTMFLSKVKVSKEDEASALVLTDTAGNFKFAGIVEYHDNDDKDEPGNWSYVLTLNEEDLKSVEKSKKLNKYLFGDDAFKSIFSDVSYDVACIQWQSSQHMYTTCCIIVDTIIQVLDREANTDDSVDIELPQYVILSASVEEGEKVFAITPSGELKSIIKDDKMISELK